jgi:glycosyltransferase involved in cell wall biosynthesis
LKILFLSASFFPATRFGGPIFSSLNLLNLLSLRGHRVLVNTFDRVVDEIADNHKLDQTVYHEYLPTFFNVGVWGGLKFLYQSYKNFSSVDVVIVNGIFCKFILPIIFLARLRSKYIIVLPRGSLQNSKCFTKRKKIYIYFFRLLLPNQSRIVWTSVFERQDSVFFDHLSATIPNIVNKKDVPEFNTMQGHDNYFLFVGRLNSIKNLFLILEGFSVFSKKYMPNYRLKIAGIGDNEYLNSLKERAKELNILDHVDFLGEIHGAKKFLLYRYAAASFLVSKRENFGNSALESLICNTPIIVSEMTLWADFRSASCVEVTKQNPESLARSMKKILFSSATIQDYNSIIKRFDSDRIYDQWDVLLRN